MIGVDTALIIVPGALIINNDSLPKVDIIIPVSNGSRFIDNCIKSLENQTYNNINVYIVADSNSTDDTIEKLSSLTSTITDIEIIVRDEKTTVSEARNIGLWNSNNDIVWFLDIDDYVYPTFLEEMVNILVNNNADIVFCNLFLEKNEIIPEIPVKGYNTKLFDNYTALGSFDSLPIYPWAHIQKREIFENKETEFYNTGTTEDLDQIIHELVFAKKVCYYNKPLYLYYKRKKSSSMIDRQKDADAIELIAERTIPFVKNNSPDNFHSFRFKMAERFMRQIAYVKYSSYKRIYKKSKMTNIIREIPDKTIEMKVFLRSKLLYYIIVYPFTHWIWDNKTGLWDKSIDNSDNNHS